MNNREVPTEDDAKRILHQTLGKDTQSISRFATGLANYVYDVTTTNEEKLVVRLAHPELKHFFEGALHWHQILIEKGVPLPKIDYSNIDGQDFPTIIMERLPGKDLVDVYPTLSSEEKQTIAKQIVELQNKVRTLPHGTGYGYAKSENDPSLKPTWIDALDANLDKSDQRIEKANVVPVEVVDKIRTIIHDPKYTDYFQSVKPECFLDDTTTKNVIIDNGKLSGIVDVDHVAYGDPLLTPALTKMSLLARNFNTDYIDFWIQELDLNEEQKEILNVYTAMFCVDFMSEIGHSFNKETPTEIDQDQIKKLQQILNQLTTSTH